MGWARRSQGDTITDPERPAGRTVAGQAAFVALTTLPVGVIAGVAVLCGFALFAIVLAALGFVILVSVFGGEGTIDIVPVWDGVAASSADAIRPFASVVVVALVVLLTTCLVGLVLLVRRRRAGGTVPD